MTTQDDLRDGLGKRVGGFIVTANLVFTVLFVAGSSVCGAADCSSADPTDWPLPARHYFLVIADTSGSMTACTTPPTTFPTECNESAPGYALNSCDMIPNRLNDLKCALRKSFQAYSGQVEFGLATYSAYLTGCRTDACISDCGSPTGADCSWDFYSASECTYNIFPQADDACGNSPDCSGGTAPPPPNFAAGTWTNGANIVVPVRQDNWWQVTPLPDNLDELLKWVDEDCSDSKEVFAAGATPIAGALTGVAQYLRAGWSLWSTTDYCAPLSYSFPTPLDVQDRACRSINVLLITDGEETCQTQQAAVDAADDLYVSGVTLGSTTWPVRTYVVNFAGADQSSADSIAAAGRTGSALPAANEEQLFQAIAEIVGTMPAERCDNEDDNCNGCIDEGFTHYANQGQTCCVWSNFAQRDACLANYAASIAMNPPDGDTTLLPCTSLAQQSDPTTGLCFDPGDICDGIDNNGDGEVDEGQIRCGDLLHCPKSEVCNGLDDDCDGQIDEDGVCGSCTPAPEVCDGCDNDCDGLTDNGIEPIPCGFSPPANCIGTRACGLPQVVSPGTCAAGGGWQSCSASPMAETCDGLDNDCDGVVDNAIPASPCVDPDSPAGLVFGAPSQCVQGLQLCGVGCVGFRGPTPEVSDGVDNDCNGVVDDLALFIDGFERGDTTAWSSTR
jgi:hypothetical protein